MKRDHLGVAYGALAAICYGTNPLGALHLYAAGLSPVSVLFYRFAFAVLFVLLALGVMRKSLRFPRENILPAVFLGFLFAVSSFSLFSSFLYMDAGTASTLLFVYPILVAILMHFFFREKLTAKTGFAITLSFAGVVFLTRGDGGFLSVKGILLVLLSSISYAVSIIVATRMPKPTGALKLNLYVLSCCAVFIFLFSMLLPGNSLQPLPDGMGVFWAAVLGFVPTFLSLVLTVKSLKIIGSTPTAILGALEPLTAVCIGVFVFGEKFSWRLLVGIVLILSSVVLVSLKKKRT